MSPISEELPQENPSQQHFGPFTTNEFNLIGTPFGYRDALPNGTYQVRVGWMEPLAEKANEYIGATFLETIGTIDVSPYEIDVGTGFNLRLFKILGLGLKYHRLFFNNTMVSFSVQADSSRRDNVPLVPESYKWRPSRVIDRVINLQGESGGADVFTFEFQLRGDALPVKWQLSLQHELWDVDAAGKSHVYEYTNDVLIRSQDKVSQLGVRLIWVHPLGIPINPILENQYWYIQGTELQKDALTAGLSFDGGSYSSDIKQNDIEINMGFWMLHPRLEDRSILERMIIGITWHYQLKFFLTH